MGVAADRGGGPDLHAFLFGRQQEHQSSVGVQRVRPRAGGGEGGGGRGGTAPTGGGHILRLKEPAVEAVLVAAAGKTIANRATYLRIALMFFLVYLLSVSTKATEWRESGTGMIHLI